MVTVQAVLASVRGGDLVVKNIWIVLVEIDALPEYGLVVVGHRHSGLVPGARPTHMAGLDLQRIVAAVPAGIEPLPSE